MDQLKISHEKEVAAAAAKASTAGTSRKVQELEEKANSMLNALINHMFKTYIDKI